MTMIVMMFLSKTSKLRIMTMVVPMHQVPGLGEQLEKIQSELSLCEKVKS